MKVTAKLTSIIVATMCAVILAGAVVRWRHDRAVFEDDMARDHMALGRYAAGSVAQALIARGPRGAAARVERMNERNPEIRIRWLPPGAPPPAPGRRDGRFYSYTALPPESPELGTIEVSESLDRERANMRADLKQALALALAMAGVAAVLSSLVGYRLLGRPLAVLARKARQVGVGAGAGSGQLGPPVVVAHADELGELAREMNLMCDRLAEANARAGAESEARAAALEALRQSDRLATVGKLAAGLAHELGTPLNVVAARAAMIAALEAEPDQLASYGRIIQAQAERMNRILRQLMDFARGGAAPIGARAGRSGAEIDLGDLSRRVGALLAPLAAQRQISIQVGNALQRPVAARGDAAQVEQALTNLVVNAIQASPAGGEVTVEARLTRAAPPSDDGGAERTYARVDVSDRGAGIPSEHGPRIFEPFFTTKDVGEGTGLGLSVAYGIARDHGGWIAVDSVPGQGSCFTLFLAVAPG